MLWVYEYHNLIEPLLPLASVASVASGVEYQYLNCIEMRIGTNVSRGREREAKLRGILGRS